MILCNHHCTPCCDFCIYVKYYIYQDGDDSINGEPIGCKLHDDEEHELIAVSGGYCDDFHCFRASGGIIMKAKLVVEGKEFDIEINDPELQKLVAPKKKTGYERVEHEEEMYYQHADGYPSVGFDHCNPTADKYYDAANYYSDKHVAANNARADKLMRQLRRFAVENRKQEIDWALYCTKYEICYDNFEGEIKCLPTNNYTQYLFCPYFDSKEAAELAIKTFHDELIWYFTEYKDSL